MYIIFVYIYVREALDAMLTAMVFICGSYGINLQCFSDTDLVLF